jgi:hypothetical protein
MPNAELLLKEAERLSSEGLTELLDFARFLNQKHGRPQALSSGKPRCEEEWPDYWAEAENAQAGSIEPKLYSAQEFIEKRSFAAGRSFNGSTGHCSRFKFRHIPP